MTVEDEILNRLQQMNVVPLLGGLVPENATAILLGYTPGYFRQMASVGQSPLSCVRRGNRRFYKVADISRFVSETA